MDAGKMVGWVINLAFGLAVAGVLYQATVAVKEAAIDTQRHGTISLGKFNRRLERGR